MRPRFWTLVCGIVFILMAAVCLILRPSRLHRTFQVVGVDEEGRNEYALVPGDELAWQQDFERNVLVVIGILFAAIGALVLAVSAARLPAAPVSVGEGRRHFRRDGCTYITGTTVLYPADAVAWGYKRCPLCRPVSSGTLNWVSVRKGGQHFHRKLCPIALWTRRMRG